METHKSLGFLPDGTEVIKLNQNHIKDLPSEHFDSLLKNSIDPLIKLSEERGEVINYESACQRIFNTITDSCSLTYIATDGADVLALVVLVQVDAVHYDNAVATYVNSAYDTDFMSSMWRMIIKDVKRLDYDYVVFNRFISKGKYENKVVKLRRSKS